MRAVQGILLGVGGGMVLWAILVLILALICKR
jgi:hypothetical protein